MAGDEPNGTNALLAEILGVLKTIDGRLEGQDARIAVLEERAESVDQNESHHSKAEVTVLQRESLDIHSPALSPTTGVAPTWPTPMKQGLMIPRRYGTSHFIPLAMDDAASEEEEEGQFAISGIGFQAQEKPHMAGVDDGSLRKESWSDVPPLSPQSPESHSEAISKTTKVDDPNLYAQYPPPLAWISTRNLGRRLEEQYGLPAAKMLWKYFVGDSWTIPPDGRVELSFQKHLLERLNKDQATKLLEKLQEASNKLEYQTPEDRAKRGSFRVSDFDIDPGYYESGVDYRSEFSAGIYKTRRRPFPRPKPSNSTTAPWKRMIEIRGLSKKLIADSDAMTMSEHEVLRDPWAEALPRLNSACPLLTHRYSDSQVFDTAMTISPALLHHQRCLPYVPPKEDKLCFHVTFYELIHVLSDRELIGEIWKSGKLHSDNEKGKGRRFRESACTVIVVCPPGETEYWTSLFLCPYNFDLYDKVPSIISNQDAPAVATDMIEFTMRLVIDRWRSIAEYFAWLIGHRDALADPEVHDSLLFDDDSFSRSRRYFWAINYLAELDVSIGGNITQLERWIALWPQNVSVQKKESQVEVKTLPERLDQLRSLQRRLKAQRLEAFALRDGLFSASGVIESRAATRLGENVKLLTSVSIFFLPLSFCMSLWSINNNIFSLSALTIVAILVSLGTYLIVFNLNNLVRVGSAAYNTYKRSVIVQMKADNDSKWNEQAKRFVTFRPKAENLEPSDWMIGFYIINKIIRVLGAGRIFTKKDPRRKTSRARRFGHPELDLSILNDQNESARTRIPQKSEEESTQKKSYFSNPFARLKQVFRRDAPGSMAGV